MCSRFSKPLLTLFLGSLTSFPADAGCALDIDGYWTLDYQYYLDQISKGDPELRAEIDSIWGGKGFLSFTFDDDASAVTLHQRNKDGWSRGDVSYQLHESTNACHMEFTFPDTQYTEVYRIIQQGDRFCLNNEQINKIEDCYVRE